MYVLPANQQSDGLGQLIPLGEFSLQTLLLFAGGTALFAWLLFGTPAKERRGKVKETRERHAREMREVKRTYRRWGRADSPAGVGSTSRLAMTTYMGHKIRQAAGGEFTVPSLDRESWFDSIKDAKAFIRSQKGMAA